jgi:preprotein translocase subunit SecB
MAEEEATAAAGAQEAPQQQFVMQRIYVKDMSFESPASPAVFMKEWKPAMNVDLNTKSALVSGDDYEVVLSLTITAKVADETAYLIEVQQAGIFHIKGIEGEDLRRILATVCPNMLFPYARETIDGMVTKGTFPALMLAPVNFDALFQQAMKQAQAEGKVPTGETTQ